MVFVYFAWSDRVSAEAAARIEAAPELSRGLQLDYHLPDGAALGTLGRRAIGVVRWPTDILFPPWEAGATAVLPEAAVVAVDALILAVLLAGSYRLWREGAVLPAAWLAFLIPLAALAATYGPTLGRYAVPLAPFILMCFLVGLNEITRFLRRRGVRALSGGRLVAAVLLPNLLLFAGDVYVQRHPDFYRVLRGGAYRRLLSIGKWLLDSEAAGPVACNRTTAEAMPILTGLPVRRMPARIRPDRPGYRAEMLRFARRSGADFVVFRDLTQPWPVWHVPPGLLGRSRPTGPYWRLWEYRRETDTLAEIDVPTAHGRPTSFQVSSSAT